MLKRPELFSQGFHLTYYPLGDEVRSFVEEGNWGALDEHLSVLTREGGGLFEFLRRFHEFKEVEFIISIRDSVNDWEEDGIWHDDGSRLFAFSLSLTLDADEIKGGRLGIRPKGQDTFVALPTPGFGGVILFLTGVYGFEHKTHAVTEGRRIIAAGWCS